MFKFRRLSTIHDWFSGLRDRNQTTFFGWLTKISWRAKSGQVEPGESGHDFDFSASSSPIFLPNNAVAVCRGDMLMRDLTPEQIDRRLIEYEEDSDDSSSDDNNHDTLQYMYNEQVRVRNDIFAELLEGLGLSGFVVTDGNSPLSLGDTFPQMLSQ